MNIDTDLLLCNLNNFIKCGAGKAALFATPGSAPKGVLRGCVGSVNRRSPLKPLWAEQLAT